MSVLHEIFEYPSRFWCDDTLLASRTELVRIAFTPREDAVALRVRAVCLPFVLVEQPCGRERTLDVRRCRLARLDRAYAKVACKAFQREAKRRRCQENGSSRKS